MKHSVLIRSHRTSLTLEPEFWEALQSLAKAKNTSVSALITHIDETRHGNLSSAVRVFVLKEIQNQTNSQQDAVNGENGK